MPSDSSSAAKSNKPTSIVYLGHIPDAFEEGQMRQFFTQFGAIKNLRLSRSKKTGTPKHYAFIEFETPEVASIVAETMNNYRLFGRSLVCEVMKSDDVHSELWKGSNKTFVSFNHAKRFMKKSNSKKTPEELKTILQTRVEKLNVQIKEAAASGQNTAILEKTKKSYEETIKKIENGEEVGVIKKEEKKEKAEPKKEEKKVGKAAAKKMEKTVEKAAEKPAAATKKATKTPKPEKTAPKKTAKPVKTETPKSEKKAETKKPKEKKEKKGKKGKQ